MCLAYFFSFLLHFLSLNIVLSLAFFFMRSLFKHNLESIKKIKIYLVKSKVYKILRNFVTCNLTATFFAIFKVYEIFLFLDRHHNILVVGASHRIHGGRMKSPLIIFSLFSKKYCWFYSSIFNPSRCIVSMSSKPYFLVVSSCFVSCVLNSKIVFSSFIVLFLSISKQ